MLNPFRNKRKLFIAGEGLHRAVVARSRAPAFFLKLRVADTIDGRFDLLIVHAFLVLEALRRHGAQGNEVGEALTTALFAGFEEALRDLGVGDMGLSRRIKEMANAFYGRLEAYSAAAHSESALAAAIERNLYRGALERRGDALIMARYVLAARKRLACPQAAPTLLAGSPDFGPIPA